LSPNGSKFWTAKVVIFNTLANVEQIIFLKLPGIPLLFYKKKTSFYFLSIPKMIVIFVFTIKTGFWEECKKYD
jgi:hypothetical protein